MLSEEDGKSLLKLARNSIISQFNKKELDISNYNTENFSKKQGIFVTLHKQGQLRGCIGFPEPFLPLNKAIIEAAKSAAFHDPRFPPLREEELQIIKIEISILTVPEEIKVDNPFDYTKQINIGKDGLIIRTHLTSGLLLPQVFTDYDCTPEQALEMTCQKANLPKDAWKKQPMKIQKFQAQIFSE